MNTIEMLLTQLNEEASEVIKESCKVLRFGMEDKRTGTGKSNKDNLVAEFCDFLGVVSILQDHGVLPSFNDPEVAFAVQAKRSKVLHYQGVSEALGTLQR